MTRVGFTVNGSPVSADVEPRTHLADFLRETLLLTGTHLGCEHGVCGACTVLLNDEPVRSCLTYAALCDGAVVRSVEGLDDDPATAALRAAFSAEHALQCGYCTPGMLVTARDIVRRVPDADDDRIRLELAGNLCRCTGYNGIVKAIRRVLDAGVADRVTASAAVPVAADLGGVRATPAAALPQGAGLSQSLRIGLPAETVWAALQDPSFVAGCVPGARVTGIDGDRITGEMLVSLGPIQARFTGEAKVSYDAVSRGGLIAGEGRDTGGTRLSGEATFAVVPDGPGATLIRLDISYSLRGALAQFGRGPVVQVFAAEIAATVARNLEARLRGGELPAASKRLSAGGLLLRVLWRVLRRWMGQNA